MVIGGLGTVWGPIVGAATLTRLRLGFGLILILFIIFWPTGIVGVDRGFCTLSPCALRRAREHRIARG